MQYILRRQTASERTMPPKRVKTIQEAVAPSGSFRKDRVDFSSVVFHNLKFTVDGIPEGIMQFDCDKMTSHISGKST